ncbi:MAG: hypothetical protein QXU32_03000 [Nitrososphaerales archaeon]
MQSILITLIGAIVAATLAMVLVWYSKKTIMNAMSKRHVLHTLKTRSMNGKQLVDSAKECRSDAISPKLIPLLLVKLQEEGLIQRAGSNMYAITTKGLESLNNLESMNKEFKKILSIMQKTSVIGKLMLNEVLERIAMISSIDNIQDFQRRKEEAVVQQ